MKKVFTDADLAVPQSIQLENVELFGVQANLAIQLGVDGNTAIRISAAHPRAASIEIRSSSMGFTLAAGDYFELDLESSGVAADARLAFAASLVRLIVVCGLEGWVDLIDGKVIAWRFRTGDDAGTFEDTYEAWTLKPRKNVVRKEYKYEPYRLQDP